MELSSYASFIQFLAVLFLACSIALKGESLDSFSIFRRDTGMPKWKRKHTKNIQKAKGFDNGVEYKDDARELKEALDKELAQYETFSKNWEDEIKNGKNYGNAKYANIHFFLYSAFLLFLASFKNEFLFVPLILFVAIYVLLFVVSHIAFIRCKKVNKKGKCQHCGIWRACFWRENISELPYWHVIVRFFIIVLLSWGISFALSLSFACLILEPKHEDLLQLITTIVYTLAVIIPIFSFGDFFKRPSSPAIQQHEGSMKLLYLGIEKKIKSLSELTSAEKRIQQSLDAYREQGTNK